MKKCEQPGCAAQIDDKYSFCYEHFKTGKKTDMKTKGQWHDDPVVDALLKINSNLSRIVQSLEKGTADNILTRGIKSALNIKEEDPFVSNDDLQDDPRE